MYLVFTRIPGESYFTRLKFVLLCPVLHVSSVSKTINFLPLLILEEGLYIASMPMKIDRLITLSSLTQCTTTIYYLYFKELWI